MNQKMALNEEDLVENVKKFPVLYDKWWIPQEGH